MALCLAGPGRCEVTSTSIAAGSGGGGGGPCIYGAALPLGWRVMRKTHRVVTSTAKKRQSIQRQIYSFNYLPVKPKTRPLSYGRFDLSRISEKKELIYGAVVGRD
jgi:hypothetical protein